MAISSSTLAAYAPWGNAQLAFEVATNSTSVDPATGNTLAATEVVEYLAALTLAQPSWQGAPGVDSTTYTATGRLLKPAVLDPRITNGSQAEAVINGYRGRFELTFDLAMDAFHYQDLRQSITGTFRIVGGPT
jgi:hypothetical protein